MDEPLRFVVLGHPRPQGSLRVLPGSTPDHPRLTQSPALVAWRHELCVSMRAQLPPDWTPLDGPCEVVAHFYLPRPRSAPKRRPLTWVTTHGDLDKYQRAVGDALTDAGVLTDDRVISAWHASKRYVGTGDDPLDIPGVIVTVDTPLDYRPRLAPALDLTWGRP